MRKIIKEILNAESKGLEEVEVLGKLNTVERNMFKSLKNNPLDNVERKWKRGHSWYLVGKKVTNPNNGEFKITFETVKIQKPLKAIEVEEKKEEMGELEQGRELIRRKVESIDKAIDSMKTKRLALLSVLSDDFK